MNTRRPPLFYYYSWGNVPDSLCDNIMAEFAANGATRLVFCHDWATRILREPEFFPVLITKLRRAGMTVGAMHAPYGAAYDLNCSDMARRNGMIEDQKLAMAYAADAGCRTFTIHVGAYSWVMEHIPLPRLRGLACDALGKLLPEAEKLGIVIAVENSFEPPNAPEEVRLLLGKFSSPNLGCCFDTGHANIMAPFPGKDPARYAPGLKAAWFQGIVETGNAFEQLREYIVTAHMHDNNGYGDDHALPGNGRVDWPDIVAKLKTAPRMIELQTETGTVPGVVPVRRLVETFEKLL